MKTNVITKMFALLAAICGLQVFGAVHTAGDQLTYSTIPLVESATTKDGATGVSGFSLTIPASADLPIGSKVTLQSIKIGRRAATRTYLVLSDDANSAMANTSKTVSDTADSTFGNVAWTQYTYNNIELTVGTTYPAHFRDAATGAAKNQTEDVNMMTYVDGCQVLTQTTVRDRILYYEVKCTVSSVPSTVYYTTVTSSTTDWSGLSWSGAGTTWTSGSDAGLTIDGTCSLSGDTAIGNAYFIGNGGTSDALTLASGNGLTITTGYFNAPVTLSTTGGSQVSLSAIKVNEGGSLTFDATTASYEVNEATRAAIKSTTDKVTFKGKDSYGATLNYGLSGSGTLLSGHLIFDGGTHNLTIGGGSKFAANGSDGNPTILVKNGTTLNFTGKDLGGWSGALDMDGVIEVATGGKLNFVQNSSDTIYYRDRLTINPGAEVCVKFDTQSWGSDAFRLQGGVTVGKEQLYVPASTAGSAEAKITAGGTQSSIRIPSDTTHGFGIFVGENSTLSIANDISSAQDDAPIGKYGAGTLKLSGSLSDYTGSMTINAGTLELAPNNKYTFTIPNRSMKGTLTIDNLGIYTAKLGDSVNYDGSATVNVKGELNLSSYRWSFKPANTLNLYADGVISGTGDSYTAVDMVSSGAATIHAYDSDSSVKVASIRAPVKLQHNATLDVADNVTLEIPGTITSYSDRTVTKTGNGTLKLVGTGNLTAAPTVSAGRLEIVSNSDISRSYTDNATLGISPYANMTMSGVISGTGSVVIDKASVSHIGFVSTSSSSPTLLRNITLENLAGVTGKLGGSSINSGKTKDATVYGFTTSGDAGSRTASFWLEVADGEYLKGVKVVLTETTSGVTAYVDDSRYINGTSLGTGVDLSSGTAGGKVDCNGNGGYGAMDVTLLYNAAQVTLSGANTYSGGTTVNNGTLVSTLASLGTGAVTVKKGGTLNISDVTIPEDSTYVKLSKNISVSVEDGGTLQFNGTTASGWTISNGYAMCAQPAAVSFLTTGGPTTAKYAFITENTCFGNNTAYDMTVGEKASKVANVVYADAENTYMVFGGLPYATSGTIEKDIWLNVSGGTYKAVFGGSNSDSWGSGGAQNLKGNTVVEVGGTSTVVDHVLGGNYKDGYAQTTEGSINVVIKDGAVVRGLIAGAGITAHNKTTTYTGNVKVLVKSMQGNNEATDLISGYASSTGYIVGGGVYSSNSYGKQNVTGDTEVDIVLPDDATGNFVKNIVGGGLMPSGGNSRYSPECKVSGKSTVSISAPSDVIFTGNIYAGGYLSGAGSADSGTAELDIAGGTFTSSILSGGFATGNKVFNVTGDVTLKPGTSSAITNFTSMTIASGKTLTVNNADAATLTLAVPGTGAISKTGVGKLTLSGLVSGANYGITVSQGELLVENDISEEGATWQKPTFSAISSSGKVTLRATMSKADILAATSVDLANVADGMTADQFTVELVNVDTGNVVESETSIANGVLTAKPKAAQDLTYTPTEAEGTFTWNSGATVEEGKTFHDYDSIKFATVVGDNDVTNATAVSVTSKVAPTTLTVGGIYSFSGSPIVATTVNTAEGANATFANDVVADAVVVTNGTVTGATFVTPEVAVTNATFGSDVVGPSMKYVRLTITATQTDGQCPAVGEFRLYRGSATTGYSIVDWPNGTIISDSTGLTATKDTDNYPGEIGTGLGGCNGNEKQPGCLIDGYYGNKSTPATYGGGSYNTPAYNKWWPDGSTGPWTVTIEFPYPVAMFSGCNFCLADHAPRNPTAWTIEVSNDGENWSTVNETTGATWTTQYAWYGGNENVPGFLNSSTTPTKVDIGTGSTILADGNWTAALTVDGAVTLKGVAGSHLTLDAASSSTFNTGASLTFDLSAYSVTSAGKQYVVAGPLTGWPATTAITVIPENRFTVGKDDDGYYVEVQYGTYWIGGDDGSGTWDVATSALWGQSAEATTGYIWLNGVAATVNKNAAITVGTGVSATGLTIGNDVTVSLSGANPTIGTSGVTIGTGSKLTVNTGSTLPITTNGGILRYEHDLSSGVNATSVMTVTGTNEFKNAKLYGDGASGRVLRVPDGDTVTLANTSWSDARNNVSMDVCGGTVYLGAAENGAMWYGKSDTTFHMSSGTFVSRANAASIPEASASDKSSYGTLLGWSGAPTQFDIEGGTFDASGSSLNFWSGTVTINLSGTGVIKAKGVFKGSQTGIVNMTGGTFELGSLGWTSDGANLNLNGGTLKGVESDAAIAAPIAVNGASTLSAKTDATLTITGTITGSAALTIGDATDNGTVDLSGATMSGYTGTLTLVGDSVTLPSGFAGSVADATAYVDADTTRIYYKTLANAITEAANGGTLVLLANVTSDLTVGASTSFRINTGSYTVSGIQLNGGTVEAVTGSKISDSTFKYDSSYTLVKTTKTDSIVYSAQIVPSSDPVEIKTVPDSGITVQPGVSLTVPKDTSTDKIIVKYGDTVLKGGTGTQYVEAKVNTETGAVTLEATAAAKPSTAATEMSMPASTETGKEVVLKIGTPVPGLFYSVLMSDSPSDFTTTTTEGTPVQATSSDAHTVSASLPTDKNVKYYRVQVKATK